MKVLVSGGAGFLGSHVCEYFRKKGDEAVALDNLTTHELIRTKFDVRASREHNLSFIKSIGCDFVKEDVRYRLPITRFKDIDFIVHCAAQPAMTIAIEKPELDMQTNVVGTYNILNLARRLDIPIVNCSTIHVYGNQINQNLRELETRFTNDPESIDEKHSILQGDMTPLHVSKRAAELYTQAFAETYGLRAATFRLTGMYGERQFGGMDHGWVANFAIRTVMRRPITLFGTGKQVRDILYALDAARAFEYWYDDGKSEIYNIGGGIKNIISLLECLELLHKITGIKQNITVVPRRKMDLWYFACNIDKAYQDFGWEPLVSNELGIPSLVDWINENKAIL